MAYIENFGEKIIQVGDTGPAIKELQIRLSGFKFATVPDNIFSDKTKITVMSFQRDYMKIKPSGIVDRQTFLAINNFALQFPIFDNPEYLDILQCPCSDTVCQNTYSGFGHNDNSGIYRDNKPHVEAYHKKEYFGIHRSLLWAFRAILFYNPQYTFTVNSGYRCRTDNINKNRQSTRHMGKAIDIDPGSARNCDDVRRRIVEKSNAQIGWNSINKKSLEPSFIAPTWIHLDVSNFSQQYLIDEYFVINETDLNNFQPITVTEDSDEENEEPMTDIQKEVVTAQNKTVYDVVDPSSDVKREQKFDTLIDDVFDDISEGVFNYVTNSDNYELEAITNGTIIYHLPVTATTVTAEQAIINIYFSGTKNTLKTTLKTNTRSGLSDNGIFNFFKGLNIWLHSNPVTIGLAVSTNSTLLISNQVTFIPSDVGVATGLHGIVNFPTVLAQGAACQTEVRKKSFSTDTQQAKREYWEILSKYIKQALNMNVIAPIPTMGSGPIGNYVGVTNVTFTYLDEQKTTSTDTPAATTEAITTPAATITSNSLIYSAVLGLFVKSAESILNPSLNSYVLDSNGLAVPTDTTASALLSLSADDILTDEIPFVVVNPEAEELLDYTGSEGLNQVVSAINDFSSDLDADINTSIDGGIIEMKVTLTIVIKNPIVKANYSPLSKQKPDGVLKKN